MGRRFPQDFDLLEDVDENTELMADNGQMNGRVPLSDIANLIGGFSGNYNDLTNKPTLGSAAAQNTSAFATAAQGVKADSALQAAVIGSIIQAWSAILDATTASFTTALLSKLNGIAAGATENSPDATLLARVNHTGSQAISTVSGLQSALDGKQASNSNLTAWAGVNPSAYYSSAETDDAISAAIAVLIGSAPGVLDTLAEIADALGDDPNFAATMTTALAGKQPLASALTSLASASANGISLATAANYAAMRALLDLEAGTDFLSPSAIAAAYQPLHAILSSIAALTTAADKLVYFSGENTAAVVDFTSVARTLLAQNSQALMRTTGLGMSSNGSSLVSAADYAAMKTLLGLATSSTPQFAAIELGHATENTLSASGGVLSIEGKALAFREAAINAQTGTSYTLALTDAGKEVTMDNGSPNELTVPANGTIALPVGSVIIVSQLGDGVTTIKADTGVTLNGVSAGAGDIGAKFGGVSLRKLATNTWIVQGNIGEIAA